MLNSQISVEGLTNQVQEILDNPLQGSASKVDLSNSDVGIVLSNDDDYKEFIVEHINSQIKSTDDVGNENKGTRLPVLQGINSFGQWYYKSFLEDDMTALAEVVSQPGYMEDYCESLNKYTETAMELAAKDAAEEAKRWRYLEAQQQITEKDFLAMLAVNMLYMYQGQLLTSNSRTFGYVTNFDDIVNTVDDELIVLSTIDDITQTLDDGTTEISKTRVGQWMSEAEYKKFLETGEIPRTNVLTDGMEGYMKQANYGDYYVEFDIDSSLLVPKNEELGWSLIKSKNQMYLKLAEMKGDTLPLPIGKNIEHIFIK